MKCIGCPTTSDGYAVIPGIGRTGEIRFYCDPCARRDRVKMRYWDARDLDVGGWREKPDLGTSFETLVLSFADAGRMRREDLARVVEWVEDAELAASLRGADAEIFERICAVLPLPRVRAVRELLVKPGGDASTTDAARALFVSVVRRL